MILKYPNLGQAMYPLLPVLPASYSTTEEELHSYILTYVFVFFQIHHIKKKIQYYYNTLEKV